VSVDKFKPHVFVLPEDDANRQLVNGFQLGETVNHRQIHVLEVAGGWSKVLANFQSDHVNGMVANQNRYMVLLIDFDGQDRIEQAKAFVPDDLTDRVFVLGVWTEPEDLKRDLGSYETIGRALARDCREQTDETWGHDLLRHNASEIDRLRASVVPLLFQSM
jgi:hypothetical protein